MGALQVMQEVGKQWQALTEEQRSYFKDKADKDKLRYLNEQKAFYDEVEKIGSKVGTCVTKEGHVVVATANIQPVPEQPSVKKEGKIKGSVMPASEQSSS